MKTKPCIKVVKVNSQTLHSKEKSDCLMHRECVILVNHTAPALPHLCIRPFTLGLEVEFIFVPYHSVSSPRMHF